MNHHVPDRNTTAKICQLPPLRSFKIETPATKSGSKYALLPARAVTELSPHAVRMLGVFASLERPSGALRMTAAERLASTGMSKSSFYRARAELISLGWMDADYSLSSQMRPKTVAKSGWYARVHVERWSVMPAQVCRALAGLALYRMKDGKGRGSYRIVARFLRITTRTLRRHLSAARNMGIEVLRFARTKYAAGILLRLKEVIPESVRQQVPSASSTLNKAGNHAEAGAKSLPHKSSSRDPRREKKRLQAWAVAQGMTMP